MCILVANPDHSVQLGTGNCVDLPPDETTSPTAAPTGLSSEILSIEVDDGTYIVDFETTGYLPVNPGMHVHFFFDTTEQEVRSFNCVLSHRESTVFLILDVLVFH